MAIMAIGAHALLDLLGEWRGSGASYEALADRIRLLVIDGRVGSGVRLPAERELAAELEISRTTVTAAYQRLREQGFALSRQGSGTRTALPGGAASPTVPETGLLDFLKAALPAPSMMLDAVAEASTQLAPLLLDSGYETIGLPVLREAVARRYTERGLPTDADQVLITVGAQQAIALIGRALVRRGDRALIEVPTYPHAYDAIGAAGARMVTAPVSVDSPEGWDVEAFESAMRRTSPAIAYLMPDFQNPTGRSMSLAVRRRLLDAAAAQGTILVADETPAELDIDRPETFPPLAATAGGGARVITIGSASKTMWGGLRVGWVRAERAMIRRLHAVRVNMDLGTPIIDQLVVASLFTRFDEVLAQRRAALAAGRAAIERIVPAAFPDWTLPHVHGGLAVWAHIGAPVSSQLALAARSEGLLVTAGPRFGLDGAFERFLRLPLTSTGPQVEQAVAALQRAWPAAARHPLSDAGALTGVV
ncbi:PLP-dependent aminotransferase family protein [Microbacterium protaetiae]|uniref:PLP-dependent aminotransferase family protein n=1 Tax=Microbacterium protaetiae TaxID=2509458 RepID=A0A4P6EA39_9MICO|nr:PLP-dependent aminotransferase family protein [Microbacterium protaetiae]QAY59000.1 PLP-dependent aminotransferase family protein [Microbacterium protaetiae]